MIKYNTIQNRYVYKKEDIDNILELITHGDFYNEDYCTQENVNSLIEKVNDFLSHIEVIKENVETERHETEEEAREYFGEDFISKFEQLLTLLDKQDTIVALHGTNPEICPKICETGLQYKLTNLGSTAIQQDMMHGKNEKHYENYETLLNWPHKNYKGIVILAIPYECYYKEGLWNKYQDTNAYGYDYRIDPDFVVGYIDVNKKQIIINKKYNRQHNYAGYIKDAEIFREQSDMDNTKLRQRIIEATEQMKENLNKEYTKITSNYEEQIDISRIPGIIEILIGKFNSIKMGYSEGMSEERYKTFLAELSESLNPISKAIPLLKTNEQVIKEQEEKNLKFNNNQEFISSDADSVIPEFNAANWEEFDWDTPLEEPKGKSM